MKTIAILGGGFCGTITAVNLSRLSHDPRRIVLINHRFPLGRGVAYSTKRPEHLLNVVARNMSALADDLTNFVEWLRTRCEYSDVPDAQLREQFLPRRIYGDYLLALLHAHARPERNRSGSSIESLEGEAIRITPNGKTATIELADGREVHADKILLATGNLPPADPIVDGQPFRHSGYLKCWEYSEKQLIDRNKSIILLGTGLTMVDVYLTLTELQWQGRVTAVSRHGLLPNSHFQGIEYTGFPSQDPTALSLAALVSEIEEHCARLNRDGINPALLVDKLRPFTQLIWQHFSNDERRTFLQQYRARWNVNRHRIAQLIHQRVSEGLAQGKLQVERGEIRELQAAGAKIRVGLQDAGGEQRTIDGDLVMNCLGPQERLSAAASPLLQQLITDGIVALDDLDLGVRVTAEFATIDRDGRPSNVLYAIGPLLRGTLWETTAVPELRVQTFQVAHILGEIPLRLDRPDPTWPAQRGMELIEYCI
ncbi:MAG: FAD/NAD(P)-binding protein [Pirellulales bacterium]|nr:FAD/NAD(P)-binding protein [Pirellulales bacterium]